VGEFGVECVSTISPKTTRRRPNSRVGEKKHISDDPQIVVNFANRLSNWSRFRHIGDDMEEGSQAEVKGLKAVRLASVLVYERHWGRGSRTDHHAVAFPGAILY
jgi:hypothetical protein